MKIGFHTLGCKVNQYETEAIKEAFVSRGAEIVSDDEYADAYIINTCTVTNIADRKSRQFIRRMKSINPNSIIVVTGCYAQVKADEIIQMEEVDIVIGNNMKSRICDVVFEHLASEKYCGEKFAMVSPTQELTDYEEMGITTASESDKARAYIKIQDGCDRFCSYCLIPYARGRVRSRSVKDVIAEAKELVANGYKEIVLTGINTAMYGREEGFLRNNGEKCIDTDNSLELLIASLNELNGDFRIRLSSLEPTVIDYNDVEKIIKYDKLCHHLHLSVQSGSDDILRKMNRHYNSNDYLRIVDGIRNYDPLYGLTTDIIVGFPGESDSDFNDSVDIVRKSDFAKVHVFRYSPRNGTVAAKMNGRIDGNKMNERANELESVSEEISMDFRRKNLKEIHRVLTEKIEEGYITGYTDNYIKVYIEQNEDCKDKNMLRQFVNVYLTEVFKDGCKGEIKVKQ